MNMKEQILVDEEAMEQCFYACEQALYDTLDYKQISLKNLLLYFFKMDLKRYLKIALVGIVLTVVLSMLISEQVVMNIMIYMMFMGGYALFEFYKTKYYHCEEWMQPVYLHPGRVFLIKGGIISCCQIMMLLILYVLLQAFCTIQMEQFLLFCFLPVFIYQTLMLLFIDKVKNMITAFCCYCFIYIAHLVTIQLIGEKFIVRNVPLIYVSLGVVLCYISMYIIRIKWTRTKGGYGYGITN